VAVVVAAWQLGLGDAEELSDDEADAVRFLADEILINGVEALTEEAFRDGADLLFDGLEPLSNSDPYDSLNEDEKRVCRNQRWDCYRVRDTPPDAGTETAARFGANGHNDRADAFRHCYWSALMTKRANVKFARDLATAHETGTDRQPQAEFDMDMHNNAEGREVGLLGENQTDDWLADVCINKITRGELVWLE